MLLKPTAYITSLTLIPLPEERSWAALLRRMLRRNWMAERPVMDLD